MTKKLSSGFSLMEMAIVLVILGVLLNGLLAATGQSAENTRRLEARNKLRQFEEALYGFAQTFGRLPCPATTASNGEEAPAGGGDCTVAHGFLPGATLNLSGNVNANSLLMDPWGNPYRYSVASVDENNTGDRAFTSSTGFAQLFNDSETDLVYSANMLRVCDGDNCATDVVLSDLVPAVILSMGANWTSYTSTEEQANAGAGGANTVTTTNDFVSTGYSEANFDDIILWLSPHLLFTKTIAAGKLP